MKVTFLPLKGTDEHFVLFDFDKVLYQVWGVRQQPGRFHMYGRTPLRSWVDLGIGTEEECVRLLEGKVGFYG